MLGSNVTHERKESVGRQYAKESGGQVIRIPQYSTNNEERMQKNWLLSHVYKKKSSPKETDNSLFLKNAFEKETAMAMSLLFRRFYKPLCSHAARFVFSKQLAEDLVSEVFFQFYKTKAYENINSSYTSYLFGSVRNECCIYLRREFGRMDSLEDSAEENLLNTRLKPDAEVHYNQLFLKVNDVVRALPTQCERVFVMSRFESMNNNEIARELQISPKTVEVHVSKALKYLHEALRDEWMVNGQASTLEINNSKDQS